MIVLVLMAGCSAEQAYNAGQTWQRQQCTGIPDKAEYDRCIARTGGTYEQYKRDAGRK